MSRTNSLDFKPTTPIADVRKSNLEILFRDSMFDKQIDFADAIGMNASHLSPLLNGNKKINDAQAKKIEEYLKLPDGWLSCEKTRIYMLANVHLPDSKAPNSNLTDELDILNKKLEGQLNYRPIKCVRWTMGSYDLMITLEVVNTSYLNHIIGSINGVSGIGRSTCQLVLEKNILEPVDYFNRTEPEHLNVSKVEKPVNSFPIRDGKILFGEDLQKNKELFYYESEKVGNILIAGAERKGKSSLLSQFIYNLLEQSRGAAEPNIFSIVTFSSNPTFTSFEGCKGFKIIDNFSDFEDEVDMIVDLVKSRVAEMKAERLSEWNGEEITFVIDDYETVHVEAKNNSKVRKLTESLTFILQKSQTVKVRVIATVSSCSLVERFEDFVTYFSTRVLFKSQEDRLINTLLQGCNEDVLNHYKRFELSPGTSLVSVGKGDMHKYIKHPYLSNAEIVHCAAEGASYNPRF